MSLQILYRSSKFPCCVLPVVIQWNDSTGSMRIPCYTGKIHVYDNFIYNDYHAMRRIETSTLISALLIVCTLLTSTVIFSTNFYLNKFSLSDCSKCTLQFDWEIRRIYSGTILKNYWFTRILDTILKWIDFQLKIFSLWSFSKCPYTSKLFPYNWFNWRSQCPTDDKGYI